MGKSLTEPRIPVMRVNESRATQMISRISAP